MAPNIVTSIYLKGLLSAIAVAINLIVAAAVAKLCMNGLKDDPNMQRPTRIGWSHSKAVAVVGFVMRIHFERVLA